MTKQRLHISAILFTLVVFASGTIAAEAKALALPAWETLEFEKKAFWATAKSRVQLAPDPQAPRQWLLTAESSIPSNSEEVSIEFDAEAGRIEKRDRVSRGIIDKRFKSFTYESGRILRERRDPVRGSGSTPADWPVSGVIKVDYPESAAELFISDPYLLLVVAEDLLQEGLGATREVLVHTDTNFYRVRLTCGNGIPVEADYDLEGIGSVDEVRDTLGVALSVQPEGKLRDKDDFSLFGLNGDIILLFDRESRLPLQLRGKAPRLGSTIINLKSAAMRTAGRGG